MPTPQAYSRLVAAMRRTLRHIEELASDAPDMRKALDAIRDECRDALTGVLAD